MGPLPTTTEKLAEAPLPASTPVTHSLEDLGSPHSIYPGSLPPEFAEELRSLELPPNPSLQEEGFWAGPHQRPWASRG